MDKIGIKEVKLELKKDQKYLCMLKKHHALNTLKYFIFVSIIYSTIHIFDYFLNFLNDSFNIYFLSSSLLILVILCRFGFFEKKLIEELSISNDCLTLNDFYNLIIKKREK